MKYTLALLIALLATPAAFAGLDEGLAAYKAKDYATAFKELRPFAEQGNAEAQYNLGLMYEHGRGVPQKPPKDNADGQYNFVRLIPAPGQDAPADHQQALVWYRKAAEQGNADAQNALGKLYAGAPNVPQDSQQALVWYRKAAEQGNADAQFNLGNMYAWGQGVPQDSQQALAWYRKAAEQGSLVALLKLGEMYRHGDGVPPNSAQAVAWYSKAAKQGSVDALLELGEMYRHGDGVPPNSAQAVAWYSKAAESRSMVLQNNEPEQAQSVVAQRALGDMYKFGFDRGVPKNKVEAYKWFTIASVGGDDYASMERDELEKNMTSKQINLAQRLATAWMAEHPAK